MSKTSDEEVIVLKKNTLKGKMETIKYVHNPDQ
jgi:hypothetical protein